MRKSKLQSTSALDNTGQRIQPGLIVGEPNGYVSGDILDANATVDVVKNTSISGDSWYDDGTGKLVPVKHPNYSTQPSILPQKIGDKYVYEQVFFKGGEGAGSDDNGLYMQFTAPETSKDKQLRLLNAKGYIKHDNDTTDVDDVMFTLKFVGDNTWKLYYDIPMDNNEYDDYMFIIEYCEDVMGGGDGYYYYNTEPETPFVPDGSTYLLFDHNNTAVTIFARRNEFYNYAYYRGSVDSDIEAMEAHGGFVTDAFWPLTSNIYTEAHAVFYRSGIIIQDLNAEFIYYGTGDERFTSLCTDPHNDHITVFSIDLYGSIVSNWVYNALNYYSNIDRIDITNPTSDHTTIHIVFESDPEYQKILNYANSLPQP